MCVFDDDGAETRHQLTERSLGIWHGALPSIAPGTRYGYRVDGPWDPAQGHRFNPHKLLLDPYARGVEGELGYGPETYGHSWDAQREDGLPAKPDPAPYSRAAEIVGADPANCLVFEDSPVGLQSGGASGEFTSPP